MPGVLTRCSGAGALLDLTGGLEQPTSGRVLIDGREPRRAPRKSRHRREPLARTTSRLHSRPLERLHDLGARQRIAIAGAHASGPQWTSGPSLGPTPTIARDAEIAGELS